MADVAVPTFKKRSNKPSVVRKRPATPPPEGSDDDSDSLTDDEAGGRVKRRKKDGFAVTASSRQHTSEVAGKTTQYVADRSAHIAANEDATKSSHWQESDAASALAIPSTRAEQPESDSNEGANPSYMGAASYGTFIQKNPNAPARQVGPVRAAGSNVRTITVTDFAPDVCKDYKQTGFCGFGDSCKFLHAREDYAQGWQLDKEWEKAGNKRSAQSGTSKHNEANADDEEKILEEIPFACIICKNSYKMPVVTKCGHYFCEKCAMERYMKEKKRACAACGTDTGGTFNVARKLKELLEKKRQRMGEQKALEDEGSTQGHYGNDEND